MDDNFSEMVKSVMSDPEAMSKLMGVAKTLMSDGSSDGQSLDGGKAEHELKESVEVSQSESIISRISNGNEERIALISALRPFLSAERRRSADNLIKMLKMMKLADMNKLFQQL